MTNQKQSSTNPRYHFCPNCKNKLEHDGETARCSQCEFIFFNNPAPCTAVIVEKQDEIMLTKRAFEPHKGWWDVPGGFVKVGETEEEGAIREIREETGLTIKIINYLGPAIPDFYGSNQVPTLNFVFVAHITKGSSNAADDVADIGWFSPTDTPDNIAFKNGRIALERYKKLVRPANKT